MLGDNKKSGGHDRERQSGKILWKQCSEKPPLKVETFGWRMRSSSWVEHAGNSIQARGTAYELVNHTGDEHAQEAKRSLCNWKATKQRDGGRLQGQTDSVTYLLAIGWDWDFTVREQAVTDTSQSDMIRSVLLEAHSGPWSIKQGQDISREPRREAGNQSRDWQPGLESWDSYGKWQAALRRSNRMTGLVHWLEVEMMGRGMNQDLFFIQTLRIPMLSVAQTWKQHLCPSIWECLCLYFIRTRKISYLCNRIVLSEKKWWTSGQLNMNGSPNHSTEPKKPSTENTCQSLHVSEVLEQAKLDYGAEVTKRLLPGQGWKGGP